MNKILRVKLRRLILLSFIVFIVVSCVFNSSKPNGETISERITFGERSLANPEDIRPERERGINSIANRNYDRAFRTLTNYLESKTNDPEARIFLNNLEVEKNQKPYHVIAVSMPISSNLNNSLEILRGVAHAQYDWNFSKSGAEGMLKIVIADDDDNDPNNGTKIAEEVATELAKRKEILGVVGHYSSDTSIATTKIYQNDQLVSISPVSTSVELTDNTPYFFRTVPSDRAAAEALAKYAQTQLNSLKAVVFYNSDSNYSKSLRREFISDIGELNIIEDPDCDLYTWSKNPEDWRGKATEVLNRVKDSANVLMLAPGSGYLDQALEIVQVNQGNLPVLGGDNLYSAKTLEKGGDSAVKMVVAVAWDIEGNETGSDFPKRSQKLWGTSSVNWRTITAYDATQALVKAIDAQAQPTREGVREELSSGFSTPGAFKAVKFSDTGDYDGDIQLVEVVKIGSGYDFVPLKP